MSSIANTAGSQVGDWMKSSPAHRPIIEKPSSTINLNWGDDTQQFATAMDQAEAKKDASFDDWLYAFPTFQSITDDAIQQNYNSHLLAADSSAMRARSNDSKQNGGTPGYGYNNIHRHSTSDQNFSVLNPYVGLIDFGISGVSGFATSAIAGWQMTFNGVESGQDFQSKYTYMPQSKTGQLYSKVLNKTVGALVQSGSDYLGDKMFDFGSLYSPEAGQFLGAVGETIPTGLLLFTMPEVSGAFGIGVAGGRSLRNVNLVTNPATLDINNAMLGDAANSVAAAEALATRRAYLDQKFGRFGDLNRDINYRGVLEQVRVNADLSAEFAAGTPRTYGRFGTKAHGEFERLNGLTNQNIVGTDYSIISEQFRTPSIGGGPGLITSRRASGSMGVDALVEYKGVPHIGLDLKTGRGWSPSKLTEIQQRFGVPIEQIHTR